MAGDVGGGRGGKEERGSFQLLEPTDSAHRSRTLDLGTAALEYAGRHSGLEETGRDGIHADAVRGPLYSQVAREADHRTLAGGVAGRIEHTGGRAHEPRNRRDVDDRPAPTATNHF